MREPGQAPRVVHDHHVEGVFPEHTWLYLLEQAGFEPSIDRDAPDDDETSQIVFLGRRPDAERGVSATGQTLPAIRRATVNACARVIGLVAGPTSSSRMAARTLA